jgi:hypothetical protein
MNTPRKMQDLRHVQTGLTPEQRVAALNENKRFKALRMLGTNWLLHPQYSGHYKPEMHVRIGARSL